MDYWESCLSAAIHSCPPKLCQLRAMRRSLSAQYCQTEDRKRIAEVAMCLSHDELTKSYVGRDQTKG
jgi:hypothetical protein